MTFDIDANGIVNVSAKDKATNKEQQIRIQASGGLDADIETMIKEAESNAASDKARRELVETRNQAEGLIHSTEKMLADHGENISEGDRRDVEEKVAELKTANEGEDGGEIKSKMDALQQASMKLGEAMYAAAQRVRQRTRPAPRMLRRMRPPRPRTTAVWSTTSKRSTTRTGTNRPKTPANQGGPRRARGPVLPVSLGHPAPPGPANETSVPSPATAGRRQE